MKKYKQKNKIDKFYTKQMIMILSYFENKNLSLGDTPNETRYLYKVHKFFEEPIDYKLKNVDSILPELKKLYRISLHVDRDHRNGIETYGYDPKTIRSDFAYISNKWNCSFRIKWLIDYCNQ